MPTPPIQITGEVYDQLFIDGIYLPYQWVPARCPQRDSCGGPPVVPTRKRPRLHRPAEDASPPGTWRTTDGHGGALKALHQLWPTAPVQRCLVHVHRNNIHDLTSRPNTEAGKALLALSRRLLTVSTKEEAASWVKLLIEINTHYGDYLNERTYASQAWPISAGRDGPGGIPTNETARSIAA